MRIVASFLRRRSGRGEAEARGLAPCTAAELISASALEALQAGTDALSLLVRAALLDGVALGREHGDAPDAVFAKVADSLAARVPLMLGHALNAPVLVHRAGTLADLRRKVAV